jgi:hypothetical protein
MTMTDSVAIEMSGQKTVPNYLSLAIGVFLTVAGIFVGPFSMWAGAAISLLGLTVSGLWPATSTVREFVKIHAGG